jgi:hypothetical protein
MRSARELGVRDDPAAGPGLEFCAPPARRHELRDDRKPKPATAAIEVTAPESFECSFALLGRQARASVNDE